MKRGSYAVITGATSGIGAAYAKRLAADGYNLLITGRREQIIRPYAEDLESSYGVKVQLVLADFTDPPQLQSVIDRLQELDPIDFLVNNAGFGVRGGFFNDSFENQQSMLQVHIQALTRLTHCVAPKMIRRKRGTIINVSSIAGFFPAPESEIYCATKSYINTFSESISIVLQNHNIKVQAVCPGLTHTDFHKDWDMDPSMLKGKGLVRWMRPEQVVDISLRALKKKRVVIVPGFFNRILCRVVESIPRRLYYRLAAATMANRSADPW